MKRWMITTGAVVALAAVTHAPPAHAQQNGGQWGIGIGVSTVTLADMEALLMPSVHVPISTDGRYMIEPSLGLLRMSNGGGTETFLRLGTGILYQLDPADEVRVYVGPRIGIVRMSNDFGSATNLTLAGVIGGEYFLGPRFSVGGEGGLRWVDLVDGSLISTTAEFRVRWYLP